MFALFLPAKKLSNKLTIALKYPVGSAEGQWRLYISPESERCASTSTHIRKIPLCILVLRNLSHMKHFSCILILLEIFAIKFVITYLFSKLHCALKSEEPFPISFNPPTTIPQSLQKLPPCLTLLCPILIFPRCPIKFRLKILMSNHPGRSSVGHSLNLQEPHQNNEDRLFSSKD